uniref:cytotoxic necrotizing factor Rho-activating domain-containing protein n=1 Tax=Vibrio campbellii TaxID=680 RepID=UPI0009B9B0AB
MSTSLFSNTPSVTVLDNRGLSVRDIAYYRHPNEPTTTQTRITHHQYDTRGALKQSADPRLHQSGKANFHYLTGLAGHVLRTQGVDNGTSVSLSDAAGRAFIAVNNISTAADGSEDKSHAVTRTWQYEGASLPGRLLSITEQVTGDAARITERFVYARNTEAEKAQNLAGQCISHYDTAGLVQTGSIALTGVALSISRRLLKDVDNPDVVADWQGGDASVWNEQLSKEDYITLTTTDATGTVLTTTDTKGNVQRVAYDVSGLMSGSWLTLKGGVEQVIVKSLTYSAAGQKLREEQGNGVVTTYSYEPETQRLIGIKTERPTGHALGTKVLQDLRYEYDPVGNVLKINNDAEETRFWRNQKVEPENTYTYDSLYQLVKATGREMANAGQQSNHLPSATIPFLSDSSAYTNYTRTYTYDETGNLIKVNHSAPATSNNYTTTMTVSDSSNRSVQSTLTENVSDVDGFFTVGGQQNQLQLGQHLIWTPRNELLKVTPVVRDGDVDDVESYRYDAGSQRLLKVSKQKAANSVQTLRALYLPGIELRSVAQGSTETENLQVITIGEAGRAQVRVLHWEKGGPSEISNDQVRYSYDSLIGSCNLEVDSTGCVISMEEYYPYGGTAILTARSQAEVKYKTVRYSGKERDATGLYYYGYRYYQPWVGRWLSSDPAGTVDGLNLYRMVRNNPVTLKDIDGLAPNKDTLRLAQGKISPLKNRGLITSSDSTEIGVDMRAVRVDKYNNVVTDRFSLNNPDFYGEKHATDNGHTVILNTFKGDQMNSLYTGMKAGSHWGDNKLDPSVNIIKVSNGYDGTLGIEIPYTSIPENSPIIVSMGALSGCTAVYATRKNSFYAYHAGTANANGDWKTAINGVESIYEAHEKLTGLNVNKEGLSNNSLVSLLSEHYDQASITYTNSGREDKKITEKSLTVDAFNYDEAKRGRFDISIGLAYALLS